MEYYWAIKRKLLLHITTWMDLQGMILSEKHQFQKVTYGMISFV